MALCEKVRDEPTEAWEVAVVCEEPFALPSSSSHRNRKEAMRRCRKDDWDTAYVWEEVSTLNIIYPQAFLKNKHACPSTSLRFFRLKSTNFNKRELCTKEIRGLFSCSIVFLPHPSCLSQFADFFLTYFRLLHMYTPTTQVRHLDLSSQAAAAKHCPGNHGLMLFRTPAHGYTCSR